MHELFKQDKDLGSAHSVAPSTGNVLSSWWNSTGSQMQQSSLPRNLSFNMAISPEPFQPGKQLGFQFHDQDSSSTQSTGQSYPELARVGESNCGKIAISKDSGCSETHGKPDEGHTQSTLTSQDCVLPSSYVDHTKSYGSFPFAYPDTYGLHSGFLATYGFAYPDTYGLHSGFLATYGTYPMIHPQMMCMTPTRVPLPLDHPQNEPIMVNRKQFHAIVRRREHRTKLEAENKLAKPRKPYLHESRHRHALNRERGPGGRFLNKKKVAESKTTATNDAQNPISDQSEFHQLENYEEHDQTTSSSDITNASYVDNMFHHQELRFPFYASLDGGPMQHGNSQSLNEH